MLDNPELKLSIEGHTDNIGTPQANKVLSEKRAKAVMNAVQGSSVATSRLSAEQRCAVLVNNSDIKNTGEEEIRVYAGPSSFMRLYNCTIENNGIGVMADRNSSIDVVECDVKNNSYSGIQSTVNSQVRILGSSIHANPVGVWVDNGGLLYSTRSSGVVNQIFENIDAGIYLESGGQASITNIHISDNYCGISVKEGSLLKLGVRDVSITSNNIGIDVSEFGQAILKNILETTISNNGTLDVWIHDGGQAICDPSKIGNLESDCDLCM